MGSKFATIAFTDSVKAVQKEQNSRTAYAEIEKGEDFNHRLSQREADFIQERDSFYMASVSETNWPYVQHRGGPVGFMRVIDEKTIGFADFRGNRQYVSTGNFRHNNRVALFFMDYPNRTRLKVLGNISLVPDSDWLMLARLEDNTYRARVERGFLIHIEAFDWNCPQNITPRYTDAYIQQLLKPLEEENLRLKEVQNTNNLVLNVPKPDEKIGGGPLTLEITGIKQLTPRVRAYELRDPDGKQLPEITAGSHLQVPVRLENGEITKRHYSICSNPARRDIYEVAVLCEDNGRGGSKAIHEQYQLGQHLGCEYPSNHFNLHLDNRPALLIAGGIGITPIKAMGQALMARQADFQIHYAGRNKKELAFRDCLVQAFGNRMTLYSAEDKQRMDIHALLGDATKNSIFYICGPNRLITAVLDEAKAQNIALDRIRFERFSASISDTAKPVVVSFQKSGIQLEVAEDKSILDAMLEAGVEAPYSCKTGECKTCAVKVLDGIPDHNDSSLTEVEKRQDHLMCPCVSRAVSKHLTLDI